VPQKDLSTARDVLMRILVLGFIPGLVLGAAFLVAQSAIPSVFTGDPGVISAVTHIVPLLAIAMVRGPRSGPLAAGDSHAGPPTDEPCTSALHRQQTPLQLDACMSGAITVVNCDSLVLAAHPRWRPGSRGAAALLF